MNGRTSSSVHAARNLSCSRSARRLVSKRSCNARAAAAVGVSHRAHPSPARVAAPVTIRWRMGDIERVGVVGCGLMGSGIAEVCARAGLDVVVPRSTPPPPRPAGSACKSLDRGVRSGKLDRGGRATRPSAAPLHDRSRRARRPPARGRGDRRGRGDEDRRLQRARQGGHRPTAILASNTSSIPIMKLGIATTGPSR